MITCQSSSMKIKRDALGMTIRNFKKLVVKQWETMGDADINVVLHTIKDPATVYLHQHLTRGGVEVFNPPEEIPTGPEFNPSAARKNKMSRRDLPSSQRYLIMQHRPHEHLSSVCTNISTLAKITDKTTLHTIINGAVRPLVQN